MKITKEKQKQLNKIGKDYTLELMVLHGSQISGKTHAMSDFDIGVLRRTDLELSEYSDLLSDLCKFFHVKEDKIDIAELKNASSLLLKEIADSGQVLYQKTPEVFIEFYLSAYKRFIDEQNIYQFEDEYLKNRYLKLPLRIKLRGTRGKVYA